MESNKFTIYVSISTPGLDLQHTHTHSLTVLQRFFSASRLSEFFFHRAWVREVAPSYFFSFYFSANDGIEQNRFISKLTGWHGHGERIWSRPELLLPALCQLAVMSPTVHTERFFPNLERDFSNLLRSALLQQQQQQKPPPSRHAADASIELNRL